MKTRLTFAAGVVLLAVFPAICSAQFGVAVQVSDLGVGIQGAAEVASRLNVRAGFNAFNYSESFTNSGTTYNGHLTLRSVSANADIYLWGPFHFSPGLLIYDGNGGKASASVPAGQTFTLGGVSYLSDPLNPVTGNGKFSMNSVAPELLVGFGNLVPRDGRHTTFNFELGVVYQGSPSTRINLNGNACFLVGNNFDCVNAATDPVVQSNIQAQQSKLNHDLSFFQWYPVASFSVGYRF